ncbi:MAG: type I-E CRISPR-associated endoribonuclease Cas2 [Alphaproteobacteria bacterium]|nr:type I-E CRISPR-associated endoribonuclease Cas2 [Alphaproteobacteria bacterium]
MVTNDVAPRTRGFLASCMLEIAPGVYTGPRMNRAVRDRVWAVVEEWHETLRQGSVIMTWPDPEAVGGQVVRMLGVPRKVLVDLDGMVLTCRPVVSEF